MCMCFFVCTHTIVGYSKRSSNKFTVLDINVKIGKKLSMNELHAQIMNKKNNRKQDMKRAEGINKAKSWLFKKTKKTTH